MHGRAAAILDEHSRERDHDAASNQTLTIDELGRETIYRYDAPDRLAEVEIPAAGDDGSPSLTTSAVAGSVRSQAELGNEERRPNFSPAHREIA